MARARGSTGSAVAIVFLGCAFVISLLVAIILYTKIETHKKGEEDAKAEMARYVAPAETGPAGEYMDASDGTTAYAGMAEKIAESQKLLTEKDREIARLTAANSKMQSDYETLDTIKKQGEANLASASTQHESMMKQRQDQVNALITEKDGLVAQISDLQKQVNDAIQNADKAARDRIAELTQQVGELEGTIRDQEAVIESLGIALAEVRSKLPQLPEPNTTLPDGRVTSVFGSGRDLFINLGRNHGLVIGMTFEIFDPLPVIRLNRAGEPRGKATVEIYSLDAEAATCRVVRMDRGEQIDPGDPIVNIAYDPDMEIKMYAFGEFDIEYDRGPNDIERIRNLITKNGAEIPELKVGEDGIPLLTPDLSYLVLGAEPVLPEKPGADEFDPEVIAAYQQKQAEVEAYYSLVDNAKLLRIPVLSQERFLELVGYYVR